MAAVSLPPLPPTATKGAGDAPTHTMAGDGASVVVGANVVGRTVVGAAVVATVVAATELGVLGTLLGVLGRVVGELDGVVGALGEATPAPAGPTARRSAPCPDELPTAELQATGIATIAERPAPMAKSRTRDCGRLRGRNHSGIPEKLPVGHRRKLAFDVTNSLYMQVFRRDRRAVPSGERGEVESAHEISRRHRLAGVRNADRHGQRRPHRIDGDAG
jgi:hypothetical protein